MGHIVVQKIHVKYVDLEVLSYQNQSMFSLGNNYAFIPGKESHELSWGGRLFLSTALLLHWAQWLGQAILTSAWCHADVRLAPDWCQTDVDVNQSQSSELWPLTNHWVHSVQPLICYVISLIQWASETDTYTERSFPETSHTLYGWSKNKRNQPASSKMYKWKKMFYICSKKLCASKFSTKQKNTFPTAFIQSERWNYTVLAHLYIKIKLKFGFHPNLIGFKILCIGLSKMCAQVLTKTL